MDEIDANDNIKPIMIADDIKRLEINIITLQKTIEGVIKDII